MPYGHPPQHDGRPTGIPVWVSLLIAALVAAFICVPAAADWNTKDFYYSLVRFLGGTVEVGTATVAGDTKISDGSSNWGHITFPSSGSDRTLPIPGDAPADGEALVWHSGGVSTWDLIASGAPTAASYITSVAEAGLSNEFAMGTLATGLVKNVTTTGVPVIATEGSDYWKPGGTDVAVVDGGTGASNASGARTNLGLVIGTDVAPNVHTHAASDITSGQLSLSRGGTAAALSDPNANNLWGWDDTDNSIAFWTLGSSLSYTHGSHTVDVAAPRSSFMLGVRDSNATVVAGTYGPSFEYSDTGAPETITLEYALPDNYDGGTVTCSFFGYFSVVAGGGTTTYFTLDAQCLASGGSSSTASYGTAQVMILPVTASTMIYGTFPALTIGNTPAATKMVVFRLSRDSGHVLDNYVGGKVGWYRLKVEYGTTALTE